MLQDTGRVIYSLVDDLLKKRTIANTKTGNAVKDRQSSPLQRPQLSILAITRGYCRLQHIETRVFLPDQDSW